MKTEVIMKRDFMGSQVSQKSKTGFFNATDLVSIANTKRREIGKPIFNLSQFLKQKGTMQFIEELQKQNNRVIIKGRGRSSQTWVHPLLFMDIALSIDPKFKVEVYQWLYDELLKHRNSSGDSYKKMCGSLYERTTDKSNFHKNITKLANIIKDKIGVSDWQEATQEQLDLRDKIHNNISLLSGVLSNTSEAVRLGISKALEK